MAGEHTLEAKILTPEGQDFDGELRRSVTRAGVGGLGAGAHQSGVPGRGRAGGPALHTPGGEPRRWAQAEGWLQVFANRATVLVGEAIPPENLDQAELRQRIED